jgi:Ca2+-binding RTX toxin-like protein
MADVFGTDNSETLNAADGVTNGADNIWGYGGDDVIFGLGGNDYIVGGSGADHLDGGAGSDRVSYFESGTGVTVSLATGEGFGGDAEGDTLTSIEHLTGSYHDDLLIGNDGNNELAGLGGSDTLKGGGGDDKIYAFGGDSTLKGGGGADFLDGSTGIDTASYVDSSSAVFVSLHDDFADGGDAEGDELDRIENLSGSGYNDHLYGDDGVNVLSGNNGADLLKGFGGADTLNGGNGDDWLDGMAGNDAMNGGNGADLFVVDSAGDTVTDTSSGTFETVYASVSFALAADADIELLRTGNDSGLGSIDLTGNASSQELRGNAGNNNLAGGLGNDILTGLAGEDAFIFNTALGAGNVDTVTDYNVAQDQIRLDNVIFTNLFASEGNWLTAGEFHIGAGAADAGDRIIYNSATGALFYDADGNGAGAAAQFATVSTGLALTSNEFFIV